MLGLKDTNDESESLFSGLTEQPQIFNPVNLHAAAGVIHVSCDAFFHNPTTKIEIEKKIN